MTTTTLLLLAIMAIFAQTAISLSVPRASDVLKVVGVSIQRQAPRNPVHRDRLRMRKRDSFTAGLDNAETLYYINATVGTPPVSVRLHIDTGSSDLWFNTPSSSFCSSSSNPCAATGMYDPNASTTSQYVNSKFNITYVDGTSASGDYVSDTVTVGPQTLSRLQFGIGYSSSNRQGILGIGYSANEAQVTRGGLPAYPNFPEQLVTDGVINSPAYSIWLNDLDASTGSILFGGVDSAYYTPPLMSLPVEKLKDGKYREFMITLTGLTLGNLALGKGESLALAFLVDTGSTLTYIPNRLAFELFSALGASYDEANGIGYVPCSLASNTSASLSFAFTTPTISVGFDELVLDAYTSSDGSRPRMPDGSPACLFGVAPAGTGTYVLGDTFLRSAYVVFDLANHEVAIAPTRFDLTKDPAALAAATAPGSSTTVKEIGKVGEDGIPGATRVENPVRATEGLKGGRTSGVPPSGMAKSVGEGKGVMWKAVGVVVVGLVVGL